MVWTDEFIKWDPKKYGNVTRIRFTTEEIWRPDLGKIIKLIKNII